MRMPARANAEKRIAAVVVNPTKVDTVALRKAVAAAEHSAKWGKTLWFETSVDDPGGGQTLEALSHGVSVVMAAGGDGTVRAVADALRGTDVPLALVPSGTGNLLARNMSLTLDNVDESVSNAFTGDERRIDIGLVDAEREDGTHDHYAFLVMAGLGLDARMLANTSAELKKRVGWLAYVEAWSRSLRDTNRLRIRYRLNDEPSRPMSAHTVLIGNCGALPANILILPDARIDDGELDIVALRPEGLIGWSQVWVKVVWENGVLRRSQVGRKLISLSREVRTLRYLKGSRLELRLEEPEEFELDGDPFGAAITLTATVDPRALAVRVPRSAP
jgi:diacylglycerol kinase family enzyme